MKIKILYFRVYDAMTCKDNDVNCPNLVSMCQSNIQISGTNISEACARSCGLCSSLNLKFYS